MVQAHFSHIFFSLSLSLPSLLFFHHLRLVPTPSGCVVHGSFPYTHLPVVCWVPRGGTRTEYPYYILYICYIVCTYIVRKRTEYFVPSRDGRYIRRVVYVHNTRSSHSGMETMVHYTKGEMDEMGWLDRVRNAGADLVSPGTLETHDT
ncbi:hypothetical protein LZ31DRAFT_345388 [Colletotrichum somersetense]|nr:hypothetical protein LZ31DRAFT_345388 [Colletotrichum somersetense]